MQALDKVLIMLLKDPSPQGNHAKEHHVLRINSMKEPLKKDVGNKEVYAATLRPC